MIGWHVEPRGGRGADCGLAKPDAPAPCPKITRGAGWSERTWAGPPVYLSTTPNFDEMRCPAHSSLIRYTPGDSRPPFSTLRVWYPGPHEPDEWNTERP